MKRTAAAVALVLAQSGCSLMFIDKPPDDYRMAEAPRCSTATGGVALDVILGILWGIGGIALAANDEAAASILPFTVAGVHGLSARAGNNWTDRCQTWQDQHDQWLALQASADRAPKTVAGPDIEPGERGGTCLAGGTCSGALVCNDEVGRCMRAADLPGPKREPRPDDPQPVAADGTVAPAATDEPADPTPARDRHARWIEFWREVP